MTDMLIKLYGLPGPDHPLRTSDIPNVTIRRAMAYERRKVLQWVAQTFSGRWADECATAFGRQPIGCHIGVHESTLAGFCCVDCTFRNFVGPIGVAAKLQGKGVGRRLLLACLHELRAAGYVYAIIGDAGVPAFFRKVADAMEIAGSKPGAYPPPL